MTKSVENWLKNVHPEFSDMLVSEISGFFDRKYYRMLKNGSSDATASDSAWRWIIDVYSL